MSASWLSHSLKKLRHWLKKIVRLILLSARPTSNMGLAATLPYHLWVPQAQDLSTESWCSWVPSKRTNWRNQFLPGVSWYSRSFLQQQHSHQPKCKGYATAHWSLKKLNFSLSARQFSIFFADSVWNLKSKRWPSAVRDDCLHSTIFWRVTVCSKSCDGSNSTMFLRMREGRPGGTTPGHQLMNLLIRLFWFLLGWIICRKMESI